MTTASARALEHALDSLGPDKTTRRPPGETNPEFRQGYLTGYQRPLPVRDQIDILRQHWPRLKPDPALKYAQEVYPTLQLPDWVEGPFAIICPGYFSNICGEELEEVLNVLIQVRNGRPRRSRQGMWGPQHLRQSDRTQQALQQLMERQPNSDILISAAQFGVRHVGRSVLRAQEIFEPGEYGECSKNIGTMILTHSGRLRQEEDLSIDCPGDEYSPDADGVFPEKTQYRFYEGRVKFRTFPAEPASGGYGSVSAFLSP